MEPLLTDDPFDSIESAQSFLMLLRESVAEARRELEMDVQSASNPNDSRRLDALRIAAYNAEKLEFHLNQSSRILNDLRTLRRLLLEERAHKTHGRAESREVMSSSQTPSDDGGD